MNNTFVVPLKELDDGPKELSGALPLDFLQQLLEGSDVVPMSPGVIDLVLTKTGLDVLVQGSLRVQVSLPCARTLDPAEYDLRPEVFLMLAPAAGEVGPRAGRGDREARAHAQKAGKKSGKKSGWENDAELTEREAAQDTYSGERVVLDDFLREFILLEVPMVPLREDLRGLPFEANPPLPKAGEAFSGSSQVGGLSPDAEKPLDPRLSPLAELKARLEKKE